MIILWLDNAKYWMQLACSNCDVLCSRSPGAEVPIQGPGNIASGFSLLFHTIVNFVGTKITSMAADVLAKV